MTSKIDKKIYDFFSEYVFKKTGIFYPEKDYYRLDSRINTLLEHFRFDSVEMLMSHYKGTISKNDETILIDLCTNNETYFFRDMKPFEALTKTILPQIIKEKGRVRIWSAACSTGQEPLSILMGLKENNPNLDLKNIMVDASDISSVALSKAKSFNYTSLDVQRGLPAAYLVKYFDQKEDTSWVAKKEISSSIKYKELNLLTDDFNKGYYDFISCRNVLIYQNKTNRELILGKLYNALKDKSFLLMGSGESLIGSNVDFVQTSIDGAMFFEKNSNSNIKAA